MAIAMTVGATKIQILQENSLASLTAQESSETQVEQGQEPVADQESCTA